MWRIIKFTFTGNWHEHEWETIEKHKLSRIDDEKALTVGLEYVLRCKKCGDIKSVII